MNGSCKCKNIEVHWQLVDLSLVPRVCQCSYCLSKGAAYVSKSGTKVQVTIHNRDLHNIVRHGSNIAEFHECDNCSSVVLVRANIDGNSYGALNANCMHNSLGFQTPVDTNFSSQSPDQKQERWRRNWCCPVLITNSSGGRTNSLVSS